jgi:hypothetical protein
MRNKMISFSVEEVLKIFCKYFYFTTLIDVILVEWCFIRDISRLVHGTYSGVVGHHNQDKKCFIYGHCLTLSSNFYYIYFKNKGIGIKITKLEELCLTANGRDNISIMIGGSTRYTNFIMN